MRLLNELPSISEEAEFSSARMGWRRKKTGLGEAAAEVVVVVVVVVEAVGDGKDACVEAVERAASGRTLTGDWLDSRPDSESKAALPVRPPLVLPAAAAARELELTGLNQMELVFRPWEL